MGFEDTQESYNLARAARAGQLDQGMSRGEKMELTQDQIDSALEVLGRMTAPVTSDKVENNSNSQATAAAVALAKSQGDTLNGMPVKYLPNGGIAYDLERIGADLGMSPEEIKGAYIDIGKRQLSPENALKNLGPGMDTFAGGAGDLEQGRRDQWNTAIASLSQGQAVLNNIANISPLENIDFTNKDVLANLAKPGFLADRTGNLKKLVNQGQGPRGAGAWARYVVPALASIVIGGGIASQFGAFGAGSTLTGEAAGAAGTAVPEAAGMGGGSAFAAESLGGPGVAAAGAGSVAGGEAINAIQSGALASGAGGAGSAAVEAAISGGVLSKVGDFLVDNAGRVIGTTAAVIGAIANNDDDDTGDANIQAFDPNSSDFWNEFVDEWMKAKGWYAEDDAYIKSKAEPAFGKYQSALSDLSEQAKTGTGNYTPTTFGMGDFRSSFVPKSGLITAENIKGYAKEDLASELAKTDVMQPNKANRQYLSDLMGLAQSDRDFNLRQWAAEQGLNLSQARLDAETGDRGTWLDAVKDILQVGDTSQDLWDKWFKKD